MLRDQSQGEEATQQVLNLSDLPRTGLDTPTAINNLQSNWDYIKWCCYLGRAADNIILTMIYSDKAKGSFCLRSCYDERWSLSLYLTLAAISMFFLWLQALRSLFVCCASDWYRLAFALRVLKPPHTPSPHPHPHMHDTGGGQHRKHTWEGRLTSVSTFHCHRCLYVWS